MGFPEISAKGGNTVPEKTEAQKKAQKKYMEKFVEIKVRVTPEKRTTIQEHAQMMGESATTFINRAIDNQISQDRCQGGIRG